MSPKRWDEEAEQRTAGRELRRGESKEESSVGGRRVSRVEQENTDERSWTREETGRCLNIEHMSSSLRTNENRSHRRGPPYVILPNRSRESHSPPGCLPVLRPAVSRHVALFSRRRVVRHLPTSPSDFLASSLPSREENSFHGDGEQCSLLLRVDLSYGDFFFIHFLFFSFLSFIVIFKR